MFFRAVCVGAGQAPSPTDELTCYKIQTPTLPFDFGLEYSILNAIMPNIVVVLTPIPLKLEFISNATAVGNCNLFFLLLEGT